jgi:hypothetical protein
LVAVRRSRHRERFDAREEEDYARGEAISAKVLGPILRSHRNSVKQTALLEPALPKTLTGTCRTIIR